MSDQRLIAHFPHMLICKLRGHRPAWLKARVQNPWATGESQVWGCERCGLTLALFDGHSPIRTITVSNYREHDGPPA